MAGAERDSEPGELLGLEGLLIFCLDKYRSIKVRGMDLYGHFTIFFHEVLLPS